MTGAIDRSWHTWTMHACWPPEDHERCTSSACLQVTPARRNDSCWLAGWLHIVISACRGPLLDQLPRWTWTHAYAPRLRSYECGHCPLHSDPILFISSYFVYEGVLTFLFLFLFCEVAGVLRLCLVPHGMQNTKYQLLWNDEMQNAKIFMGVFSFIQITKFFMRWVKAFWLFGFFFGLLRLKSKMENR
jgi:hypothetical protein